jgi:hypothetical protein
MKLIDGEDKQHLMGRLRSLEKLAEINAEHLCTAGGGQAVNGQWH